MPLTEEERVLFQSLVEDWSGIHLSDTDLSALDRAVRKETARIGVSSPLAYYTHLRDSREERDRFIELLTNNETYFFREPDHFNIFAERLLPEVVEQRASAGEAVRILSAGCSMGEEPYSIAITLLRCRDHLPPFEFEIVGVDIDRRALTMAKKGIFRKNSFRHARETARLDAWFDRLEDGRFQLCDEVIDQVRFRYFNLNTELSVKDTLGEMDVIFFRNVSIYLSPDAAGRINRNLVACLKEGGYLLVGSAEVQQQNMGRLLLREIKGLFLFQKAQAQRPNRDAGQRQAVLSKRAAGASPKLAVPSTDRSRSERQPVRRVRPDAPMEGRAAPERPEVEMLYKEALEKLREERKEEALEKLRRILEADPGHANACRLMADICLNNERFEEAAALCHRSLEIDPGLAWPHLFLGLIRRREGDYEEATKALKTAIYMRPDYWPAHFYLGEVYRSLGKRALAVREYRNVLSTLKKWDGEEETAIVSTGFSSEYIVQACRENVQNLTG